MRAGRFFQQGLVVGLPILGTLLALGQASAQERVKIEITPDIPHSGGVNSVAFSPNGTRLLSGSEDKTLKLWDAASGQMIRTFEGHSRSVKSVTFSPDGARLASGSQDNTVRLWDAASARLIHTFEGHSESVQSVAFSPDGTRLLSGSVDNTLKLWDAASGQLIRTFEGHTGGVRSVAFSPDGTRLLSSSLDRMLRLWDAASGRLIGTFEGHSTTVNAVAFSPDGTHLLSGSGDILGGGNGTLKLWDAASGQLLHTIEGDSWLVNLVAFSPDGTRLLSGGLDLTLKLWDAASGQLILTFEGHTGGALSVAFSPDGTRLLSGGTDKTLRLWDAVSGQLIRTLEARSSTVTSAAFSPDGTRLLSGNVDHTVKLWDAASGQLIRTIKAHSSEVTSVAFSPDGSRVLSGSVDQTLKLWDAASGQLIRAVPSSAVQSVAFSPDGTRLLSGDQENTLKLWEAASGQLIRTFEGHSGVSVAFSPDGTRVLSGSLDQTLKLWDVASGRLIRTFDHSGGVYSVAYSPDGSRLLSGGDDTLRLWEAASGELIRIIENSEFVWSVAFSPDGTRLLSGGEDTLKLWDAASGRLIQTVRGHFGSVRSVVFSPDGTRLLSGSSDTTIRLWDVATGAQLGMFIGDRDGEWLTMTPSGFFAASSKGTEVLSVVRGLDPHSMMQFYDHLHRPDLVAEMLKGDPESKHKDAARRLNLERILDSGPAPRIELLPDRTEKSGETVKLAARLIDDGGGIGPKVIWRVNGKTQGATTVPGLGGPVSLGRYVVMPQTLTVDPTQKNEVEIIAYNGKGLLATPPLRFTIDAWGVATQERPRLFVLAVGVDKYAKAGWQLRYAAKDADAFAAALKAVGSPLFGEPKVTTLLDTEVTEGRIAAEFERLSSIVKARDVFVLFVGGHGRSIAGEGWFYLPQDLDFSKGHTIEKHGIGQDKWQKWMAKIPAQKSLTVLDACESGANEAFRGGDRERETVMAQLEYATGRNIIAAAPAGKAAYEGYKNHGLLTYALLDALHRQDGGEADTVDVYGLAAHVSRQVPIISQREFGVRQQPRFTPTGDNFPIGVRAAVLMQAPISIPTAPTHVNTEPLKVYKEPGGKGGAVLQLPPFTTVTVVKNELGWAYIGRNGEVLGYVAAGKLQRLAQHTAPAPVSLETPRKQPAARARPKRNETLPPAKDADWPSSFLEKR